MKKTQISGDWDFKAAYKNTWLMVCAFELCREGRLKPEEVQRFFEYKIYGWSYARIGREHGDLQRSTIKKSCNKVERYCEARLCRYEDRSDPKNIEYKALSYKFIRACSPLTENARKQQLSEIKIAELGFTPDVEQELLDYFNEEKEEEKKKLKDKEPKDKEPHVPSFWWVANKINGKKCRLYDRVDESKKKGAGESEECADESKKKYVSEKAKRELLSYVEDYIKYSRKSNFKPEK